MEKLRTFERQVLRHTTGLYKQPGSYIYYRNAEVYNKAKIIRIDNFMTKQALKFVGRCATSENELVRNITTQQVNTNDVYKGIQHLQQMHEENLLYDGDKIKYYNGVYDSSQYT
jgi:hypothetical protein